MEREKIKEALWCGDIEFLAGNMAELSPVQTIGTTRVYSLETEFDKDKLSAFIGDLKAKCKDKNIGLSNVWVIKDEDQLERYFAWLHNGTNGKENCVLGAMEDIGEVIKGLKAQCQYINLSGASFDNSDDVYDWLLTVCLN